MSENKLFVIVIVIVIPVSLIASGIDEKTASTNIHLIRYLFFFVAPFYSTLLMSYAWIIQLPTSDDVSFMSTDP